MFNIIKNEQYNNNEQQHNNDNKYLKLMLF
jgi:hypothetical protein